MQTKLNWIWAADYHQVNQTGCELRAAIEAMRQVERRFALVCCCCCCRAAALIVAAARLEEACLRQTK